jgi:hypothetical protein
LRYRSHDVLARGHSLARGVAQNVGSPAQCLLDPEDLRVEHPRRSETVEAGTATHIAYRQGVIGHPTASRRPPRALPGGVRTTGGQDWKSSFWPVGRPETFSALSSKASGSGKRTSASGLSAMSGWPLLAPLPQPSGARTCLVPVTPFSASSFLLTESRPSGPTA